MGNRVVVAYLDRISEQVQDPKQGQDKIEQELKRLEQAILEKAFRGEL